MTENIEYDVRIDNIKRQAQGYTVNLSIPGHASEPVITTLTKAFKVKLVVEPKPPTERVSVTWALKNRRKAMWSDTNRPETPAEVHSITRLSNGTLAVSDADGHVINHAGKDDTIEVLIEETTDPRLLHSGVYGTSPDVLWLTRGYHIPIDYEWFDSSRGLGTWVTSRVPSNIVSHTRDVRIRPIAK